MINGIDDTSLHIQWPLPPTNWPGLELEMLFYYENHHTFGDLLCK
jgi:hypothetical protein